MMTPIYLNSSSNDQYNEHQFFSPINDPHIEHQFLSPNSQASSSSNSLTCHLFFNSTTHDQDGGFNTESHPSQLEGDNFETQAYDDQPDENKAEKGKNNGGLKFSLWKRESYDHMNDESQVKWMSSKMRVMLKMKKSDPMKFNTFRAAATDVKLEDHKEPTSSPMEENANSNSSNSTSSNYNIAIPIRVCSDCNTTKTPLWRSGPQGPKSLCNACGIRQRKARKALAVAAAAAAETGNIVFNDKPASLKPIKIIHKDHKKPNNGHVTKHKRRQHPKQINMNASPSISSSPARKNRVEEFLVSLSQNLTFHRVFPQDEKEAAILLMALSCGYAHQ